MRTGQLAAVVRRLACACEPGWTDGDLLGSFLAHRDDASFETLVRRHGDMVMGVCHRLLPTRQDAEDAFQVTFLVLARRASSVRPREQVGAWLHGVAYRTAMGHRRSLLRRGAKERSLQGVPHPAAKAEQSGDGLLQAIDRELDRLPEKLRLPVVLCDLEGHSLREAARQLGLPDATLSNRLRLARRRIAARLREHGITPEGSLAPMLLGGATSVTPGLIASVCSARPDASLAAGCLFPRRLLFFIPGGWKTMWLSPFAALALLAGAGMTWLARDEAKGPPRVVTAQAAPRPEPADPRREGALKALGEALEELRAAGAMDDGRSLRHRVFLDMAVFETKLGRRAAARKLFKEADDLISSPQKIDTGELRMLVGALAKAGEKDEAVAAARRIPADDQYRNISLQEAAAQLAKRRREKDALEVAGLVKDPKRNTSLRPMILQEVALAHARAGGVAEALRVVERMEPAAKITTLAGVVILNRSFRAYPEEPGIALIQAEKGDLAAARKTLEKAAGLVAGIADKRHKDRSLTALVCARARLGDTAEARKVAEGVTNKDFKVIAEAAVVRALVKAGKVKEALAEAAKQADPAARVHMLTHIGAARAAAKDAKGAAESFAAAHTLLDGVEETARGGEAHILVTARAEAGDAEGAAKSAEAFLSRDGLGRVNMAYARAKSGDYAGALKLAEEQEAGWWKGNTVRAIAMEQTSTGGEKAARAWIARLGSPQLRANALFGVAEGLMKDR